LEYPDGLEIFIELLVFPDAPAEASQQAVNSLHDSVIWNNVSTGPETEEHLTEEKKIYALITEREQIKARSGGLITLGDATPPIVHKFSDADAKRIDTIRHDLKKLIGHWKKQGYKYTGRVYREIAMQNSDYGGMENVGNTTIISSRLIPSEDQPDRGYAYYEGVKIHEYYHNINGSQVTGLSPFEIWLNEAVTVHIQRKREDELFGHDYNRLSSILANFRPGNPSLAITLCYCTNLSCVTNDFF
jgi:aminopeptidase N